MRVIAILCLSFTLMFFDCSSKKNKTVKEQNPKPQANMNMNELLSFENEIDGIEYKFKAKIKKAGEYDGVKYTNDFVEIEYELNNTSDKDHIVFNRGHSGTNSYKVYVEPNTDGAVEISQKAFEEPTEGRRCPQRFVAITPNASWLKVNQKISEKVQLEMPLETRTPFDDCEPKPELPKQIKQIKFCIGVAEADSEIVKLTDDGRITGMNPTGEQKLLCSDPVSFK